MDSILYSIGDKGIYDAILQGKITKDHLEDIFLSRGVIISHKTDRRVLAHYFSRFPHSYQDFLKFSAILGSASQRERLTHFHIRASVDVDDLDNSITSFVEYLEEKEGASCYFQKSSEDEYKIIVNYKIHNFNRSEFRQITNKDAIIEIVKKDDSRFLVRHPNNKTVKCYIESLVEIVDENANDDVLVEKLSLTYFSDSKTKTAFLNELINQVDGFDLHDVIDVYVYHPKELLDDEADDEEEDNESGDFDKMESISGTHISKASLKGVGILESDELHQLYEKGFYLYRIIWQAKRSNSIDSDIYEFEATFTDPEKMTDFSYIIKGYFRYKGHGEYAKTRVQPSGEESAWLNELIEDAAHTSMEYIESLENASCKN